MSAIYFPRQVNRKKFNLAFSSDLKFLLKQSSRRKVTNLEEKQPLKAKQTNILREFHQTRVPLDEFH